MKLTKQLVKWFEQEQKEYGTKVALFNLLWSHASQQMKDIGVTRVKTEADV